MLLVGAEFYRTLWWWGAKFRDFLPRMSQLWESFSLDTWSLVWTINRQQCQRHISSAQQQLISYQGIIAVAKTGSHQVRLECFSQVGNQKIILVHIPLFSVKLEAENLSVDIFPWIRSKFKLLFSECHTTYFLRQGFVCVLFFSFLGIKIQNHPCSSCLFYFGEKSRHGQQNSSCTYG